jgi:hypothetical protein
MSPKRKSPSAEATERSEKLIRKSKETGKKIDRRSPEFYRLNRTPDGELLRRVQERLHLTGVEFARQLGKSKMELWRMMHRPDLSEKHAVFGLYYIHRYGDDLVKVPLVEWGGKSLQDMVDFLDWPRERFLEAAYFVYFHRHGSVRF